MSVPPSNDDPNDPLAATTDTLDHPKRVRSRPRAGGAGLVLLYAPDPNAVVSAMELARGSLVIGRDPPPGGLRLPFGSVSRTHARLAQSAEDLVVEDLESRNGTFVNGEKVERAVVAEGDEIRVGEILLEVVEGDAAAHAPFPLEGRVPPAPLQDLRGGLAMQRVRDEITRTAPADFAVLVTGETGTGKELVAAAIHAASGRRGRLRAVNCAAIPAQLLESELFGYKRGAFTGADADKIGIVRSANGGTLFLDEIGDMPLDAQAKLLRLLETREVTPLGSHQSERVDVRIVCATHRALPKMVREDRFRADLYARISGHVVVLPPLRERKEDIFQLVHLFVEQSAGTRLPVKPAFMLAACAYDWPFNVRELQAAVRRAVALADGELDEPHLPADVLAALEQAPTTEKDLAATAAASSVRAKAPSEEEVRALLARHDGNVAAVAREVGKDRAQVHRWLRRYGIALDEYRR